MQIVCVWCVFFPGMTSFILLFFFVFLGGWRGGGIWCTENMPFIPGFIYMLHVAKSLDSLVDCVVFCKSLFVPFLLAIVLSVILRFTASGYLFDIFKLSLKTSKCKQIFYALWICSHEEGFYFGNNRKRIKFPPEKKSPKHNATWQITKYTSILPFNHVLLF